MTQAPPPATLARFLRQVANQLDTHGDKATELAALLAARGYPTGGSGNGSRSSDTTSSTENAALNGAPEDDEPWHNNEWDDIDQLLRQRRRTTWLAALDLQSTMAKLLAHAGTDDRVPAGTGDCYLSKLCEEQTCRPTLKHPDNRLRNGLGPACHQAWVRYRKANPDADRQEFLDWRRATLRRRGVVSG